MTSLTNSATLRITYGGDNVSFTSPNILTLNIPNGWASKNDSIALDSLYIYYSWKNISASKNNNTFSYIWTNGISYPVVMPDGQYSYSDLNGFLHQTMRNNGHYLVNNAGEDVYYMDLEANSIYYCITLTSRPIPSTLPADWTNPANVNLSINTTPQLVIPNTNFAKYVGFTPNTYPPNSQSTEYQINGTGVPQVTDASSINVNCNVLGFNPLQSGNTIATFTTSGIEFGAQIAVVPTNLSYYRVSETVHQTIQLSLVDQNNRPLQIVDYEGWTFVLRLTKNI